MINKPRLVIIPGVGKNSESLAARVKEILENDFKLGPDVEVFSPEAEVRGREPDRRNPFIQGYFSDNDPKAEAGKLTLQRAVDNNYIAIVRYMDDPESNFGKNDDLMHLWAVGDLLNNANPARRVLAIPYTPFLRSHSNRKYHEKGVAKAYTMGMFLQILKHTRIDRLITIEPHARTELEQVAEREFGIDTTFFSPFDDPRAIDYLKLGTLRENKKYIEKLGVFKMMVERKFPDAFFIAVDDGAEDTCEDMVYKVSTEYEKILAFLKTRTGEGHSRIIGLKSWCRPDLEKLRGGTAVILDDMVSSGGSADDIAQYVKEKYDVAKVVLLAANPVCPHPDDVRLDHVDETHTLGTVPHQSINGIDIDRDTHPYMLSAGLFKSYSGHIDRMEQEMNRIG